MTIRSPLASFVHDVLDVLDTSNMNIQDAMMIALRITPH